ncbi:MAG: WD40 repeat domain-containing protein [Anaerolineales bacterium]|nr:WD40 repeat domain-containing protein [Anaerolineales bacterium]
MFCPCRKIKSFIYIILFLSVLLAGCSAAVVPESAETPAETAKPVPSDTPVAPSPVPNKTRTPRPTDQPIGPDNLIDYPLLASDNLAEMVFLEARTLDPEGSELNFHVFDWSNDGSLLVICSYASNSGSSYQIYDLVEGSKLSEVEIDENACDRVHRSENWLKFSRDGKTFLGITRSVYDIVANSDSQIGIFNSTTGEQISGLEGLSKLPEEEFSLYAAAFSSQGTRLAILVYEHARPASTEDANVQGGAWIEPASLIELFDVESGDHWGSFHKQKFWSAVDLEYSTEGEYLVFGVGESVQAWSVDGVMTYEIGCIFPQITFSPTSEVAALTCGYSKDNLYHLLWDLKTGHSFQIAEAPGLYSQELRYSQDGRLLIGLSDTGEVSIWHAESGEYLFTLPDTYPTAVDAHFTGDGRLVAVLLEDGSMELYGVK